MLTGNDEPMLDTTVKLKLKWTRVPVVQSPDIQTIEKNKYNKKQVKGRNTREKDSISCSHCNFQFQNQASLEIHIKNTHILGQYFSCPLCPVKLKRECAFKYHLKSHQDDELVPVGISNTSSLNKFQLSDTKTTENNNELKSPQILQMTKKSKRNAKLIINSDDEKGSDLTSNLRQRKPICQYCRKRFYSTAALNIHKAKCHYDYNYTAESKRTIQLHQCRFCDKSYKDGWHLTNHFMVTHSERRDFVCPQCYQTYKTKRQLQDHTRRAHIKGKSYSCPKCNKDILFQRKCIFEKHIDIHNSEDADILLRMPPSENGTDTRMRKRKVMDALDNNSNSAKNEHLEEENKIMNKNPVNIFCSDEFSFTDICVPVPPSKHGRKANAMHPCSKCRLKFRTSKTLKRHHDFVHKGRMYKKPEFSPRCTKCFQYIADDYIYQEHIKKCHSQKRDFECSECNKTYAKKKSLSKHIKETHLRGTKYHCKFCKKKITFRVIMQYRNHMASHKSSKIGDKSFVLQSPVDFKSLPVLKKKLSKTNTEDTFQEIDDVDRNSLEGDCEMEMNNGEEIGELFSCSTCTQEFVSEEDLRKHHMLAHFNPAYQCDVCGKTCETEHELEEHEDSYHYYGKRYHCQVCEKDISFTKPEFYDEHMTIHMQKNEVNHNNNSETMTAVSKAISMDMLRTQAVEQEDTYHHYGKKYYCTVCKKYIIFNKYELYNKHMIMHMQKNEANHAKKNMTTDGSATDVDISKNLVTKNKKVLGKSQNWICSRCNVQFGSVKYLITHKCQNKNCYINNAEANNGQCEKEIKKEPTWRCSGCSNVYESVHDLIQHSKTHRITQ